MITDVKELKGKIQLILSEARAETAFYAVRRPGPATLRAAASTGDPPVIEAVGDVELVHEEVRLLKLLAAQCSPSLQGQFAELLLGKSSAENAKVVVHAMIEVGGLLTLLTAFKGTKALDATKRRKMWEALRDKLAHESHRFTEADLTAIEEARQVEEARARTAVGERMKRLPPTL